MTSSPSIFTTSAVDQGGGTSIAAIHPDIIQSHILNRLDGAALASTSCVSSQFLSLCNDDRLWKDICNSAWPSTTHPRVAETISAFPYGHRSFYSDTFSAIRHCRFRETNQHRYAGASELISAVDIFYDSKLIHSKVMVTETSSSWFQCTPLRLELLEAKETVEAPDGGAWDSRSDERLRVSWILIDPVRGQAVNVASRQAVESGRHWLTDDIQLRYASVLGAGGGELVSCAVVVTCGGKEGSRLRVKEVSMQMEDMEGKIVTGMESLRILEAAMEGRRCKSDVETEKDAYESFVRMKARCREMKERRERGLDMVVIATGICIFFAFFIFFLWR